MLYHCGLWREESEKVTLEKSAELWGEGILEKSERAQWGAGCWEERSGNRQRPCYLRKEKD